MFHPRFPGAAFAIVAAVGLLYPILVHAIAKLADVPVQRATWLGGVSLALLAGFTLHVWRRRTIGADELQGVLSALTSRDLHSVDAAAKRLKKKLPLLVGNLAQDTLGQDSAELVLFDDGGQHPLPRADKLTQARVLINHLASLLN